jgi:shikimate kinase
MIQHKRIFIIGHPGAGKALVGKNLAGKLGYQFIDADLWLERRIGRFLSEIVGKPQGVDTFIQCQTDILINQLSMENIVVGTDASLLAAEKNKKLLSSEFVVYLKVSTPTQLSRMKDDPLSFFNTQTLLPLDDYGAFLDKLHQDRDSVYEQAAKLIIDTDNNALEEHIAQILNAVT